MLRACLTAAAQTRPLVMRFCLVTSTHISNNPRLVKEADALSAAGHHVRVVAVDARADLAERDEQVLQSREWRLDRVLVDRRRGAAKRWASDALRQRIALTAWRYEIARGRVRDLAVSRHLLALVDAVAREPADVVVAHNLAALPAAGLGARRLHARMGFDAEDLHVGELPESPETERRRELAAAVEATWLPQCATITASAPGIADELVSRYGVPRPLVVWNAFPSSSGLTTRSASAGPLAVYWYSQVIGRDRGLDDVFHALRLLDVPISLHLRGEVDASFRAELLRRSAACGRHVTLAISPPAAPDALVALAAEHDVGLALEEPVTLNRAICVTNKLMTYLAAGLAIAASDTPGQRAALQLAPGAGLLYPSGDPPALSAVLRAFAVNRRQLEEAKRRARLAANGELSFVRQMANLTAYLVGPFDGAAMDRHRVV